MLYDILSVVKKCKEIGKVCVLSPDEEVLNFAFSQAVESLKEPGLELNLALEFARKNAIERGADAILIIPGDVPLISEMDLNKLVRMASEDKVVVITKSKNRGTNALLLKPPDVIPFRFGGESFPKHVREAIKAGAKLRVYESESLSFDVDKPEDLIKIKVAAPWKKTSEIIEKILEKERILNEKVESE